MRNKYFDEPVTENDLFYVCFMIAYPHNPLRP